MGEIWEGGEDGIGYRCSADREFAQLFAYQKVSYLPIFLLAIPGFVQEAVLVERDH